MKEEDLKGLENKLWEAPLILSAASHPSMD